MTEVNPTPPPLSKSMSLGLLFTSITWMALTISLVIVGLHAESFRKNPMMPKVIWVLGAVMILVGAVGAWLATDELAGKKKPLLLFAAIWVWLIAASLGIGGLAIHKIHRWPVPELLIGVVLSTIFTLVIALRPKRDTGGML